MRALLESGRADVVIGSRYVRGSKILGWGPMRYINSHVANRLARLVTGVPANDATNGLRLFRRQVLETLPADRTAVAGLFGHFGNQLSCPSSRLPNRRTAYHFPSPRGRHVQDGDSRDCPIRTVLGSIAVSRFR